MDDWKAVRVSAKQYKWLKEQKEDTGIPISEAVRRAIEQYRLDRIEENLSQQDRRDELIEILRELLSIKETGE